MSLERLLDHKCEIYHALKGSAAAGYGLPDGDTFSYPSVPDVTDVDCHFAVGATVTIDQKEPQNEYTTEMKLVLRLDADIRLNDKVVWLNPIGDNYEYTAKLPRKVRNHHKFVMLQRVGPQKAL